MQSEINAEWVVGRFLGEQAKSVLAHANMGIGYKILSQGKQGNGTWVLAAFKRGIGQMLPDHLTRVTDPLQVARLNAR